MFSQRQDLTRLIDHTLLRAEAVPADVGRLCDEALEYGFATVCVAPCYVEMAFKHLEKSQVRVCTVVGFPLGHTTVSVKIVEAMEAIKHGAQELDLVINRGALKSGDDQYVRHEILNIVNVSQKALLKVILETGALTRDEIVRGARLAMEAGARWIKTSTGFGPRGASVEDVKLLKETVGDTGFIKAAGGIRDLKTVEAMVRAGASRVGTSHGVSIVQEYLQLHAKR